MVDIKPKPLAKRITKQINNTQKQAVILTNATEDHIERHLFKRFHKLFKIKTFLATWVGVFSVITLGLLWQLFAQFNYFQTLQPVPGGIYNEGILGNYTNINPIFATNDVDTSLSRLVFASLLRVNNNGTISYELASNLTNNSTGTEYTVTLKNGLTWQDGKPLTAADVLYTYQLIQNPDVNSPLRSNFEGVTISTKGNTIIFDLPNALASFPDYLNVGIIPKHLLSDIAPSSLRSANFNTTNPVGSGPFSFGSMAVNGSDPSNAEVQISLKPFDKYALGKPKLDLFMVHAYASKDLLVNDLIGGKLNGAEGLSVVPSKIGKNNKFNTNDLILNAGTYLFLRTSNSILSDSKVRGAIAQAIDVNSIISNLGYSTNKVDEPFLTYQREYNSKYVQGNSNVAAARMALQADGWSLDGNSVLSKNNQELSFNLTVSSSDEYINVANQIKSDLKNVGIQVNLLVLQPQEFSSALEYHQYDSVLYGIGIGADPDVYAYWGSDQFNLATLKWTNLSEYSNKTVDSALSNGRTRLDPLLRSVKYEPFLAAWQSDNPAVGLYQPRDLYITKGKVFGLSTSNLDSPADRFMGVNNWEINESKVTLN